MNKPSGLPPIKPRRCESLVNFKTFTRQNAKHGSRSIGVSVRNDSKRD